MTHGSKTQQLQKDVRTNLLVKVHTCPIRISMKRVLTLLCLKGDFPLPSVNTLSYYFTLFLQLEDPIAFCTLWRKLLTSERLKERVLLPSYVEFTVKVTQLK